jgi:hypothetical protein
MLKWPSHQLLSSSNRYCSKSAAIQKIVVLLPERPATSACLRQNSGSTSCAVALRSRFYRTRPRNFRRRSGCRFKRPTGARLAGEKPTNCDRCRSIDGQTFGVWRNAVHITRGTQIQNLNRQFKPHLEYRHRAPRNWPVRKTVCSMAHFLGTILPSWQER